MTREEKLELYYKARDAYYGTGEEILSDGEFDALEKELGLENKSDLGKARSTKYTVKHPCIQGSLSKVQVVEDANGDVQWDTFAQEAMKYTSKANSPLLEITPKLDGVSFEFLVTKLPGTKYDDFVVSTRGDGNYGKDITEWFRPVFNSKDWSGFKAYFDDIDMNTHIIIRGEILVDKEIYRSKYSEFTNPRSFVSGSINSDWEASSDNEERRGSLSWVCYDYRLAPVNNNSKYTELSLIDPDTKEIAVFNPLNGKKYKRVGKIVPNIVLVKSNLTVNVFKKVYDYFDNIRANGDYALDGFVIKPQAYARAFNNDKARPVDCIAIKFLPMREATTIRQIVWTAKKTPEYFPVGICDPVIMDGKKVTRVSLNNYNWCLTNNVAIGAQINMSLAGDIIPKVYKILSTVDIPDTFEDRKEILNIPEDAYETVSDSGNIKLMSTADPGLMKFIASVTSLNIMGIGPALAAELFNIMDGQYNNIIYYMQQNIYDDIIKARGNTKSTQNAIKALEAKREQLSLDEVIASLSFPLCGKRASKQCANYILTGSADFAHIPNKAVEWVKNTNSPEYNTVMSLCNIIGLDITQSDTSSTSTNPQNDNIIPVILTGSPSGFGYATKKEWLASHPEYVETTSWKECQLLITDDLTSTSGKMKKATSAGIPIKTYALDESYKPLIEKLSRIVNNSKPLW